MGCCLAAALVFSLARKGWWALTGQTPPGEPFPPAARRLAPGEQPLVVASVARREARPLVSIPVALAAAAALYVVTAALLGASSALPRDLTLAATLLVALVLGTRFRPQHREAAAALAAAGALWSALALLDMHAFGLEGSLTTDVAVHGVGLLALYVGLALWQPLRRPAPPLPREGLMS